MKKEKLIAIAVVFVFSLFFIKGYVDNFYDTKKHIVKEMEKHLIKKHNKEFIVLFNPITDGKFYEGIIIPKEYVGTPKGVDRFYKTWILMKIYKIPLLNIRLHGEILDGYEDILVKNDLEKICKPKLEELFGKNILVALELQDVCTESTAKEEIKERKRREITDPLTGGIYIFGRVENEKDREKYRRGIYEFIQYLKQEGMFEYVDLTIFITDERFLSKEFDKLKIHEKLLENYREYRKTRKSNQKRTPEEVREFVKKKQKIYSEIGENYTLDTSKIDKISKYEVIDLNENLMCGIVAVVRIVSEKSIKTNYFLKDEKIKQYDKVEDVELE